MRPDTSAGAVAVDGSGERAARWLAPELEQVDDRTQVAGEGPAGWRDAEEVLSEAGQQAAIVLVAETGLPSSMQMRFARRNRAGGRKVFVWWPADGAIEPLEGSDWFRVGFQLFVSKGYRWGAPPVLLLRSMGQRVVGELRRTGPRPRALLRLASRGTRRVLKAIEGVVSGDLAAVQLLLPGLGLASVRRLLGETLAGAKPEALPLPGMDGDRLPPRGVYVRLDWWNAITSGGSYGHTCFVAAELARRSDGFVCLMANHFPLLDELGVTQYRLAPPFASWGEPEMASATEPSLHALRAAFQLFRPGFVYERLVVGNFAVARVCQELGIPYVLEYNGSESSMMRSFGGRAYLHESLYLQAERAAFSQAALISVVSDPIRKNLLEQGVPASKILVDPNGVDPDRYAPATPAERHALRRELGYGEQDFVVGFTGTFGGWHGIDDLAEILPRACAQEPRIRFLLIGDGSYMHLVEGAVARHELHSRVRCMGRVPQQEGARLLRACDAFLSPHNSHMVDSQFFGSPTKVFEYMAVGSAIVASDLEQIGEVLRPSLRSGEVSASATSLQEERAVLCTPGDVPGFVEALVGLARNSALARLLGRNARGAALREFTWARHVERLAAALAGAGGDASWESAAPAQTATSGHAHPVAEDTRKREGRDLFGLAAGPGLHDASPARTVEVLRESEAELHHANGSWLGRILAFEAHRGQDVLEIGSGLGSDLARFARAGCRVTNLDPSPGQLAVAQRSFERQGLSGTFVHCDANAFPFADGTFDLVYCTGGMPAALSTRQLIDEMWRLVRPGGSVMLRLHAQRSLHYWVNLYWKAGVRRGLLEQLSMGELASREAERRAGAPPLAVRVYKRSRIRRLFGRFERVEILQRPMLAEERPPGLRWADVRLLAPLFGWNLVVKARKPCVD